MRRIPPPPPGVPAEGWRVPGEAEFIDQWNATISRYARKVPAPHRLGMDHEDVECEMRGMLLIALRKFAAAHGHLPPPAFVVVVLKRRISHFSRASRKWWRKVDRLIEEYRDQPEPDEHLAISAVPSIEQDLEGEDLEEVYRALVYVVRRDLPPAAFAILHLRVIEELTPVEIAELAGIDSNSLASKRIGYAKRRAWALLKALGIERWEDIAHTPPEVAE